MLATHWHDDHIKGIARVLEAAASAKGAFPEAMVKQEYFEFARKFHDVPSAKVGSGVREFGEFLQLAINRTPMSAEPARAWLTLVDIQSSELSHGNPIRIQALSPSTPDIIEFIGTIAGYVLPQDVAVSAPYYDRNDVSVALFIDAGTTGILLGADLENVARSDSGWKAVLLDSRKPPRKASLYKVAHHGAVSGDHRDIWTEICQPEVIATLAPWSRGGNWLPTRADVERIYDRTNEAYGAARTVTSGTRHPLQSVNSILQNTSSKIRNVDLSVGQVRHRLVEGAWQTDVFGHAVPLNQIATAA